MSTMISKAVVFAGCLAASAAANAGFFYGDVGGIPDGALTSFTINGPGSGYNNFAANQFNCAGSQLFNTAGVSDSVWQNWNTSGPIAVHGNAQSRAKRRCSEVREKQESQR